MAGPRFFGNLIIYIFVTAILIGCEPATKPKDGGSSPNRQGADGNRFGNADDRFSRDVDNQFQGGGVTDSRFQTQGCSIYSGSECSMRGCDLLTTGCSTAVSFNGSCTQYADQPTCSKYIMNGCGWMANGTSIPGMQNNPLNQPGTPIDPNNPTIPQGIGTTSMGSCVMQGQGGQPWQNGQLPYDQQSRFNSMAAIGAVMQCMTQDGACGNGIIGILGKVITAGRTQQMLTNVPTGGYYNQNGTNGFDPRMPLDPRNPGATR